MKTTPNDLQVLRSILNDGSWTVEDVAMLGAGVGTRTINRLIRMGLVQGVIVKVDHELPMYDNNAQPTGQTHIRTFGEVRYLVSAAGCEAVNR